MIVRDGLLTEQLIDLTRRWNHHEDVPASQQAECRRIGKDLNAAGGIELMRAAYYAAKAMNRSAGVVQHYWDGIGEWQA